MTKPLINMLDSGLESLKALRKELPFMNEDDLILFESIIQFLEQERRMQLRILAEAIEILENEAKEH